MAGDSARLVVSCPDRPGIIAAVSSFLFANGANIVSSDQHSTDPGGGRFFLRMEYSSAGVKLDRRRLGEAFQRGVGEPFEMSWWMSESGERRRVAILVSREEHCVLDLLWRWRRGELAAEIPLVASNHRDCEADVCSFGVPFEHVPVPPGGKAASEQRLLELLVGNVDLVVLARYMQVLSGDFLARLGVPVINIHHSFLPAFAGQDPYGQAHRRGVKIIGATAHYVIEELDAGPIIVQDVAHVSHRDSVADLARVGREIERTVLAEALTLHLEDRVLRDENRTVVFR